MKILVDKSFERDSKRLPVQVHKQLKEIIQRLSVVTSLHEVSLSKMEGAKNAYRIRLGNYRIGIYLEGDQIVLSRVLDRKDIYKYFPKK
jgi:mRNA interferase RelE/StbE